MLLELDMLGFNPYKEAEKATKLHRYEQQMLFDFCVEFIRQCADDSYGYDDRNFEAHKKSVDISTAYYEYTEQEL